MYGGKENRTSLENDARMKSKKVSAKKVYKDREFEKTISSKKERNNNKQQAEFIMIRKRSVIILGIIVISSGFSIITSVGIFASASLIFIGIYLILKAIS